MKCYLYILKNSKNSYYTGITKLFLIERLRKHNNGDVKSTKFCRPWQLIYTESFDNFQLARKREKQIKSWHGGNAFKKLLAKAAGSSNGRTSAFGAEYLGSNPSPAALAGKSLTILELCIGV